MISGIKYWLCAKLVNGICCHFFVLVMKLNMSTLLIAAEYTTLRLYRQCILCKQPQKVLAWVFRETPRIGSFILAGTEETPFGEKSAGWVAAALTCGCGRRFPDRRQ